MPAAITITVLMIPLCIAFAFIIPGMNYFPVGMLTVIVYMMPMICLACNGNMFRSLIIGAIYMFFVEWGASFFAPEATAMMHATGVHVSGSVTDAFFGYNLPNVIISAIHRMF